MLITAAPVPKFGQTPGQQTCRIATAMTPLPPPLPPPCRRVASDVALPMASAAGSGASWSGHARGVEEWKPWRLARIFRSLPARAASEAYRRTANATHSVVLGESVTPASHTTLPASGCEGEWVAAGELRLTQLAAPRPPALGWGQSAGDAGGGAMLPAANLRYGVALWCRRLLSINGSRAELRGGQRCGAGICPPRMRAHCRVRKAPRRPGCKGAPYAPL